MNAKVRPVGPKKAIGCPAKIAYIIPAMPLETMNSITPMLPSVIRFAIPPKATTGARHVKYKNNEAPIVLFRKPSIQSDLYCGALLLISFNNPENGAQLLKLSSITFDPAKCASKCTLLFEKGNDGDDDNAAKFDRERTTDRSPLIML